MAGLNADYPLVSIAVVTYNSEATIRDTLDSIRKQTYKNIEVIISDDCSTDSTVELCKKWIENESSRFIRCSLIVSSYNMGTSSNCNKALKDCQGEWIKFIAGDDALLDNSIETFVTYVKLFPGEKWFASRHISYWDNFEESNREKQLGQFKKAMQWGGYSAEKQFFYLIKEGCPINASSFFLNKYLIAEIGGFDEKYRLIEDYPLMLKMLKNGVKCFFIDEDTVKYRKRRKTPKNLFNMEIYDNRFQIAKDMRFCYMTCTEQININLKYKIVKLLNRHGLNRNNKHCKNLFLFSFKFINIITFKHGAF